MKKVTAFGKLVRTHRMDRGALLIDMADHLGVSPSFVSSVEFGRKPVPPDWPVRIAKFYELSAVQLRALEKAA